MSTFEFIVTMSMIGVSAMGYLLLFRTLKKQIKELKKDKGNEE